jgi:2-methylcitrate dehydratase
LLTWYDAVAPHFAKEQVDYLVELGLDLEKLQDMDVDKYVDLYVKK